MWEGSIWSKFQRDILTKAFVPLCEGCFSMAIEAEMLSGKGVMDWPLLGSQCEDSSAHPLRAGWSGQKRPHKANCTVERCLALGRCLMTVR